MPVLPNSKHERFAQEVANGATGGAAYIAAGYAVSASSAGVNASRLLKNAKITDRIDELHAFRAKAIDEATGKAAEALAIDRTWILGRLRENVERAMQAVEVKTRAGIPTGEWVYEGAVANRALELLGKELGMFRDRGEVTVRISHEDALKDLE